MLALATAAMACVLAPVMFFWERICAILIHHLYLNKLRVGCLTVEFPDGSRKTFGDETSTLKATITINRNSVFSALVLRETIGLAEGYMAGDWDCPDLARFTELILENIKARVPIGPPFEKLGTRIQGLTRWFWKNSPLQSLSNVQEHYDIGNEMYGYMLDAETMSYTCALWRNPKQLAFEQFAGGRDPRMTLGQAQLNKIHLIIEKAGLKETDEVVELGCGWGGFAIEAAKTAGCRIRAYNLSKEQLAYARAKAKREKVDHLVTFVEADYRTATGPVDKVVSIGMFEHVGDHYFLDFFNLVEGLLKPGGTAVIHTITSADEEYPEYKLKTGFIQKYIFPGCCIPAVSAIISAMGKSRLELQHMENLGEHYALTLRAWRENFYKNVKQIEMLKAPGKMKYDESFQRMWDFYLANCEAEFTTGHFGLGQFIFRAPSKDARDAKKIDSLLPRLPSLYQAPGKRASSPRVTAG